MVLSFTPHTISLRRTFSLASGSRNSTPAVLVEVEQDGLIGYGEAALPPSLGEDQESVTSFLEDVSLPAAFMPDDLKDVLVRIDAQAPGNSAAKAGVDIALHDWMGKAIGLPCFRMWGLDPSRTPASSFTVATHDVAALDEVLADGLGFEILKVKLGQGDDRAIMTAIRQRTSSPIRVDVNQGWSRREDALEMCEWLAERNVELVEQPFLKTKMEDTAWLARRSPLPIIVDESAVRLSDVEALAGNVHGINVKLMKCTGVAEARKMIERAHAFGLKAMLGCMTETSCAISAAAQIGCMADWVDLDGAVLTSNDPFVGARLQGGRIMPRDLPGIGVVKKDKRMPEATHR